MKRIALLIFTLLLLTGCRNGNLEQTTEKNVCQIVYSYLENSAAGNWQEAYKTLTGEALAGAEANSGQIKTGGEKIISNKFKVTQAGESLARVDADFTESADAGFDRLAYSFDLIRSGDRWLIYKTTWGEYLHDGLKPGQLPGDAAGVIKTYLEASYADRRAKDHIYLSGKLLQDSERSKMLPVDVKAYGALQKTVITVKDMECLGLSDDYAVSKVTCDVFRDNTEKRLQFLIETTMVNGTWKICNIENL